MTAITFTLAATIRYRAVALQMELELLYRHQLAKTLRDGCFHHLFQVLQIRDKRVHVFLFQINDRHAAKLHSGGRALSNASILPSRLCSRSRPASERRLDPRHSHHGRRCRIAGTMRSAPTSAALAASKPPRNDRLGWFAGFCVATSH